MPLCVPIHLYTFICFYNCSIKFKDYFMVFHRSKNFDEYSLLHNRDNEITATCAMLEKYIIYYQAVNIHK